MSGRLKTIIGVIMVGIGLIQVTLYAVQTEWIPTSLGAIYREAGRVSRGRLEIGDFHDDETLCVSNHLPPRVNAVEILYKFKIFKL